MEEAIAKATVHVLTRWVIDLPFALLMIRIWVWGELPQRFDLPSPSWKQTWGIAIFVLTVLG